MKVADEVPGVMHVDLTLAEVRKWYEPEKDEGSVDIALISADGIHPNARCYKKWAQFVGNSLADQIMTTEPSNKKPWSAQQSMENNDNLPAFGGGLHIPVPHGLAKQHE